VNTPVSWQSRNITKVEEILIETFVLSLFRPMELTLLQPLYVEWRSFQSLVTQRVTSTFKKSKKKLKNMQTGSRVSWLLILQLMVCLKKMSKRFVIRFINMEVKFIWTVPTWMPSLVLPLQGWSELMLVIWIYIRLFQFLMEVVVQVSGPLVTWSTWNHLYQDIVKSQSKEENLVPLQVLLMETLVSFPFLMPISKWWAVLVSSKHPSNPFSTLTIWWINLKVLTKFNIRVRMEDVLMSSSLM